MHGLGLDIHKGIEYALRDEQIFLHVSDRGKKRPNPTVGGLVSTKFRPIMWRDFEANCDRYMAQYAAILVQGKSACLRQHKQQARHYIEDNGITFLFAAAMTDTRWR